MLHISPDGMCCSLQYMVQCFSLAKLCAERLQRETRTITDSDLRSDYEPAINKSMLLLTFIGLFFVYQPSETKDYGLFCYFISIRIATWPFYILLHNKGALHKALILRSQQKPAPTTCSQWPSAIDLNYPPFGCTSSFNARSIPCNWHF